MIIIVSIIIIVIKTFSSFSRLFIYSYYYGEKVFITNFTKTVRLHYKDLQYTISKLQRTSSSIGFVQQALHHKFTPTFAKVNGNFGHTKDK